MARKGDPCAYDGAMKRLRQVGVVLASTALFVACRTSTRPFPERHRSMAAACSSTRPPGYTAPVRRAGGPTEGDCQADTDCTQGKNGRCSVPGHDPARCSYDRCTTDAECGAGNACDCNGGGNRCVPANCRTDAECGGLGCSPTQGEGCGNLMGTAGFYCHTKKDDCTDHRDCKKKDVDGMCVYSPSVSRWTCNFDVCNG